MASNQSGIPRVVLCLVPLPQSRARFSSSSSSLLVRTSSRRPIHYLDRSGETTKQNPHCPLRGIGNWTARACFFFVVGTSTRRLRHEYSVLAQEHRTRPPLRSAPANQTVFEFSAPTASFSPRTRSSPIFSTRTGYRDQKKPTSNKPPQNNSSMPQPTTLPLSTRPPLSPCLPRPGPRRAC